VRVLLLNPPGDRPYLRDYYCSSISKSGYYWHPIDLLVLSARLGDAGHEVSVLDAIAERVAPRRALERVARVRPEAVISLAGATSWREDRRFLAQAARLTGARMIGCGEVFLGETGGLFAENGWLEAGIRDFTDPGIPAYLATGAPCSGVVAGGAPGGGREAGAAGPGAAGVPEGRSGAERLSFGVPRHELFPLKRYRYPYHRHHPFASVLTAYGCPFRCSFCNSGFLGFRLRDMGDVALEIEHVRALGLRQLFVKDMSFGAPAAHARAFCDLLERSGPPMSWNCYARLDSLDPALLAAMRRAGCHLVQMGLETANPSVGRAMGKVLDRDKALEVFRACRRLGVRTGAHFVLGLPGETGQGIRETVELALRLDPDYASFNLFMPRHGSALAHLLGPDLAWGGDAPVLDPSETLPARSFCALSPAALVRWRGQAVRAFYLRPGYLLRQGLRWRTRAELGGALRDAWGLARNLLRSSRASGRGRRRAGKGRRARGL